MVDIAEMVNAKEGLNKSSIHEELGKVFMKCYLLFDLQVPHLLQTEHNPELFSNDPWKSWHPSAHWDLQDVQLLCFLFFEQFSR